MSSVSTTHGYGCTAQRTCLCPSSSQAATCSGDICSWLGPCGAESCNTPEQLFNADPSQAEKTLRCHLPRDRRQLPSQPRNPIGLALKHLTVGTGTPGSPALMSPTDMLIHTKPFVFWLNSYSIVCWAGLKVLCLRGFYFSCYLCNRLLRLPLAARREKLHLSADVVREKEVGKDHSMEKAVPSWGP